MKKSAFISDIIFAFAVVFLPVLCFFRYLRLPLVASLLFAAAAGILAAVPVWFFLDRKRDRLCLKKQDEEEKNKLLLHLALSTGKQNAEYFRNFFLSRAEKEAEEKEEPEKKERKEFLCKTKICGGLYAVETEDKLYFPLFTVRPADGDSAAVIVRAKSDKQKCLLCGELAPETEKLCAGFGVETTTGNEIYRMLKKEDFLPEHYLCENASAPKKKKRLRVYFAKSNSRHFLWGGVLILLTSLITPFPLYYLIFGSVLILSSIFVRIFGYR